jgi:hypothetical protein
VSLVQRAIKTDRADRLVCRGWLSRAAAQAAERGRQSAIALRALHDTTRLGDTRAVDVDAQAQRALS